MADLPELSDLTKRKLTLRWSALLNANRLTGEHFHWQERERLRLQRIAAQGSATTRGSSTDWRNERAADNAGILPSVTVSEARFKDLSGEYYRLWIRSGDGYEVFAAWLEELKRQVSAEIGSVWRGKSPAIDRWYERACGPAVEKTLGGLVREGINRARDAELKRLEARIPSVEGGFPKLNRAGATNPSDGETTRTATGPAVNKTNSNQRGSTPQFPKRALWLKDQLRKRAWTKHDLSSQGGPDPKTVQKILDGFAVREDVLQKVAGGLSKKGTVGLLEIPPD